MRDVSSPASPTVGLTAIAWADTQTVRKADESSARAVFTGSTIRQNVRGLYDQKTITDFAYDLTVPGKIDADLLQPQKFEAALLDVFDKIATATANDPQAEPAHATLHVVTEAMAQCRDKIASLNQV